MKLGMRSYQAAALAAAMIAFADKTAVPVNVFSHTGAAKSTPNGGTPTGVAQAKRNADKRKRRAAKGKK